MKFLRKIYLILSKNIVIISPVLKICFYWPSSINEIYIKCNSIGTWQALKWRCPLPVLPHLRLWGHVPLCTIRAWLDCHSFNHLLGLSLVFKFWWPSYVTQCVELCSSIFMYLISKNQHFHFNFVLLYVKKLNKDIIFSGKFVSLNSDRYTVPEIEHVNREISK